LLDWTRCLSKRSHPYLLFVSPDKGGCILQTVLTTQGIIHGFAGFIELTRWYEECTAPIFLLLILSSRKGYTRGFYMSENYGIHHHHQKTLNPLGTNRRKKYLVLFLLILLAASAGVAYYAYTSGLLAEDNPHIPQQMVARINIERQAHNLPPVQLSQGLTNDAIKVSREVRISPRGYQSGIASKGAERADIFVVPKISWAISDYDSQQQMFTTLENDDPLFRENILDSAYTSVGVGVTGDSYNYYIVTIWG
jgi:hypothetical protein